MDEGDHGRNNENAKMLDAALSLGERGFCVFPIRQPYERVLGKYFAKKNGKYPASVMDLRTASSDREAILRAFKSRQNANIGILTGRKCNLVIIDVDFPVGGESSMKNLDLPSTLTAATGDGLHLYYRHPGIDIPTCAGQLAPGIDVKGEHSFATVPPSLHYSGVRYQWLDKSAEIGELPAATVDAMRGLPHRSLFRDIVHISALANVLLPISAVLGMLIHDSKQKS
jgi:hypothetical protein